MGNSYKFLKIVFIILILVIIGEVGYYFGSYANKDLGKGQVATNVRQVEQLPSLPLPTLSADFTSAIHPDQIKDLATFVNSTRMNEKYYLTVETDGTITDINRQGKQVGQKLFPLGLKVKSGEIDDWTWLSPQMFRLLEVDLVEGDGIRKTTIDALKVGDHVLIQQMTSLAYAPFDPRSPKAFIIKILK